MLIKKFQDYISIQFQNQEEVFQSGYKFLKEMESQEILPWIKILENGCEKIIYICENIQNVNANAFRGSERKAWENLHTFLGLIREIDEIGFICKESVLVQSEYVFYDSKAERFKFLIVPRNSVDDNEKEKWIHDCVNLIYILGEGIKEESLIDICEKTSKILMKEEQWSTIEDFIHNQGKEFQIQVSKRKELKIETSEWGIEFEIQQEEFVLGKHPELADGCISVSSAVSRRHCKIVRQAENFGVIDLGSVNGTFINGVRISSELTTELKNNDILRLADVEFTVKIEEGV